MELSLPSFRLLLKSLPQAPVAVALRVTPGTISRWANAKREPSLAQAIAALSALGYTVHVHPTEPALLQSRVALMEVERLLRAAGKA